MQIPAMGYGLRYHYGMFRQEIKNGEQVEYPDNWLRRPDPWEIVRPEEEVERVAIWGGHVQPRILPLPRAKPRDVAGRGVLPPDQVDQAVAGRRSPPGGPAVPPGIRPILHLEFGALWLEAASSARR